MFRMLLNSVGDRNFYFQQRTDVIRDLITCYRRIKSDNKLNCFRIFIMETNIIYHVALVNTEKYLNFINLLFYQSTYPSLKGSWLEFTLFTRRPLSGG